MSGISTASRQTGVDVARDLVRNLILRGEIAPGSRLTLADLARRVGVSVTPVREALRDLAASGLIDIDPHKGARVHAFTAAEMAETYALRSLLESRAMAEVANLEEEDRVVACALAAKLATQMEVESDVVNWAALNRDFHARLAEPLREAWPVLFDLVESLRNRSMMAIATALRSHPDHMSQSNCGHRALIDAVRVGDSDYAGRLTTKHLNQTLNVLLRSFG
ncbi:GntR family transcriptional regulator [Mycobacterium montefiorense]|uniref:GntR family transcriptional regulator n=1 Tax=Mycobacterium montefiorense TaxID=154654 RepID=A0AA37UU08_9MYCO|nr:GntR family transcriptional regulator [Mycobacterium montefiorense]GBG37882.1 GntR family transcriptional regulator [Mycobacterium montefiorense]GKU35020.1 GntR family transcriptional regulator [Mycobacterium montefiorense]GKU41031.1 GntR family transcriptional regulator [Mycobacterium montefiorense]GKU47142.1 GntR family transcriptional regulator [Mycobacterium montefiorense]GKU49262.1 GntR family transcriptional regulator [Mycobacterium montefiorense]